MTIYVLFRQLFFLKKKLIFVSLLLLEYSYNSNAQKSITFEAGQVFSRFSFSGTDINQTKEFSYNLGNSYSLYYTYFTQEGVFFRTGIGNMKAGATTIYVNKPSVWSLNYINATFGMGYIFSKFRFKPYLVIVHYFGYLQNAWQKTNTDNFDMKKHNVISNLDYGVFLIPGVKVFLSEQIAFHSEFKQIIGLADIETTPGQRLSNRGFILNLGVSVSISKNESNTKINK